ncbi:hypothetical protein H1164_15080 [Thermoactinomyces daqus]|uniref:Uncharacterized protein n=1 Tax=Thermoactinomyces daqus TaxID=1329516 RepID=A0A7W2AJC0_9BACL|nr:hypothetical protein [Thermoactinomyces daqus]MBA4544185.1 hypothetical protein [Thermoactinomyces daqus]
MDILDQIQDDLIQIRQALWIGELEAVRESVLQLVEQMECRINQDRG